MDKIIIETIESKTDDCTGCICKEKQLDCAEIVNTFKTLGLPDCTAADIVYKVVGDV